MTNYKLNPLVAWLALGLFMWVTVVFMWVFWNFSTEYAAFVERLGGFYMGYSISLAGIVLGFFRAIIDGFCSAFLLVWIYNAIDTLFKKSV